MLLLTSERRRFLGSSFATSGGRTTCLNNKPIQINKINKPKLIAEKTKENGTVRVPIFISVIEVLLGVLDLTHRRKLGFVNSLDSIC